MLYIRNNRGSSIELMDKELMLGRAQFNLQHPRAANVSREQCTLEISDSKPQQVQLTSRAVHNATLIHRKGKGEKLLLHAGESCMLDVGDRICMLSSNPEEYWELVSEAVGGDDHSGKDGERITSSTAAGSSLKACGSDFQCRGLPDNHIEPVSLASGTESVIPDRPIGLSLPTAAVSSLRGADPVSSIAKRRVMLIMVGVPGSGKSTFSEKLEAYSDVWKRVNQDTVNQGQRGTQEQCQKAAVKCFQQGQCVIIDRCSLNPPQRKKFLELAASMNAEVHAVVLNLPQKICHQQAAERIDHEGNVSREQAGRIVAMMTRTFQAAGLPSRNEGFSSVLVCENHKDIESAYEAVKDLPLAANEYNPESSFRPAASRQKAKLQSFFKPKGNAKQPVTSSLKSDKPAQAHATELKAVREHPAKSSSKVASPQKETNPSDQQDEVLQDTGTVDLTQAIQQHQASLDQSAEAGNSFDTGRVGDLKGQGFQPLSADALEGPVAEVDADRSLQIMTNPSSAVSQRKQGVVRKAEMPQTAAKLPKIEQKNVKNDVKRDAFATLMSGSRNAKHKGKEMETDKTQKRSPPNSKPAFARGHHADALRRVAQNPESERPNHPDMEVHSEFVIIRDKFPKARLHGLVVARDLELEGPADLSASNIPLLEAMEGAGLAWAGRHAPERAGKISLGFHAVPSLRQLHLHVISQDFVSPWLKTKKHWNSFTTEFFMLLVEVKARLRRDGSLRIETARMKALLQTDLQCHKCGVGLQNMPKLVAHIATCSG